MKPFVSIIVPCYNEVNFIRKLLQNIVDQDYPMENLEIFVVDGMSSDGTRKEITEFIKPYPFFHLLDNEKRYAPFALNIGISNSKGEVIMRMDAHAEYPANYVSGLVESLYQLNADNVGGSLVTLPGNSTITSLAIASALSSPFGIGNAHFRLGIKAIRQVDTVPFGCYRREVFERIGLFDEDLLRNQDDGFNAKLTKNGGRIFLIPDIKIRYYARTSVSSTWKMYYQYGLFKPLGNKKAGRPATLRQFVPPAFVLFLVLCAVGSLITNAALLIGLSGFAFYLLANLIFTVFISKKNSRPRLMVYLPWIFFIIHISYGLGYLHGIVRFIILRREKSKIGYTRG
jgi:glycosyltransferase involved in cell wall biosynthesis